MSSEHFRKMTPDPSIERTCPGKPGNASHLKRYVKNGDRETWTLFTSFLLLRSVLLELAFMRVIAGQRAERSRAIHQ